MCRTSRSRGVCASCLTAATNTFPCRAKRRKHRPRPCAVRVRSQPPALRMLMHTGVGLFGDRGSSFDSTREHPLCTGLFGMSMSRQTPPQLRFSPQSSSGRLTGRWSPWEAALASASNPVSGSPRLVLREKGSARPLAAGPGTLPPPARARRVTHVGAPCAGCSPAAGRGTRGAARCRCRGRRPPAAAAPLLRGGERAAAPMGAQPGKGEAEPGDSSARPRGRARHPGTARPSPAAAAAPGRNSGELPRSQGRALGWPGEPERGPAVGPVRPVPVRGQALLEGAGTGAGGPTLTFKGAQQRLLPGHGFAVPQGRVDGNGEQGTGNWESGKGNGPRPRSGAEQPCPTGGGNLTHTGVRVLKLKAH